MSFQVKDGATYAPTSNAEPVCRPGEFHFASCFLNHGHIYGQTNGLRDAGGTLKWVYDPDQSRVDAFVAKYPGVKVARSFDEVLADPEIKLINGAAIPCDRAAIGQQTLAAGKHYFTDKAPFTTMEQLAEARAAVRRTGLRWFVYYSERLHNDAAWQAGEIIRSGALGRVLQVLNLAPHRLNAPSRPAWFFDKKCYGGILTDIGSHQVEQFLTYAGCADATVNFARSENFNNPAHPGLEDFGELSLSGDNGASFYGRVDWFTPGGQSVWGDGRTFVVGTQGSLELRKYTDIARSSPASRLFLTDGNREQEIDCLGKTGFPFFGRLIRDLLDGTDTAMSQAHVFKAAELTLRAQALADAARERS